MQKQGLSKIHFPTILGLLILLVAIGVGVFLVKTRTSLESGAEEVAVPKQVHITNVTDSSFTVSWITDILSSGKISYGTESNSLKQQGLDERDKISGDTGKYETHHVKAESLEPSTSYYFKIESDGKKYDNNGQLFEVNTGSSLGTPPAADAIYGTVLTPSGTKAEGVIVYLNVANAAAISALTKTSGNWTLSLSTARSSDLASYLNYDTQATIVNIIAQGSKSGTATAITTTMNDSPVPDITLGQNHDFRTIADSQATGEEGSLGGNESEDEENVSSFNLDSLNGQSTATSSGEVTLENPSYEGEIINATQPAIIGTGPVGTVLSIEINSENTYTGSVVIDENGEWEFVPPEGLELGEHTVTIAYLDSEGEEQTLSRNFVIAEAGTSEDPVITATPSGESTPSATPVARTSMPSTESGVPDPGSWEISLLMLLTGLGLVIGGVTIRLGKNYH